MKRAAELATIGSFVVAVILLVSTNWQWIASREDWVTKAGFTLLVAGIVSGGWLYYKALQRVGLPPSPLMVGSGLNILSARYGVEGLYADVTTILRGYVESNRIDIQVNNAAMRGDPAFGQPKHLVVIYTINGHEPKTVVRHEGRRLRIPEDAD